MQKNQLKQQFEDVLNGNDVEALKTALQNLMLLFETQNRNYLELKSQVKNLKLRKPNLSIEHGNEITIFNEDALPKVEDGLVQNAYELLASIRIARKSNKEILEQTEKTIDKFSQQEQMNNTKLSTLIRQD
ncbi:hypothetical protein M9Y10_035408 [Tritrichomonas musculus]|uniref:Uncharacterized protein n=1 Tax=Tritrichomonas musculus TaxID=1915356 RepID=A0ABR2KJM0_9EUKA